LRNKAILSNDFNGPDFRVDHPIPKRSKLFGDERAEKLAETTIAKSQETAVAPS
jgi:hypothetical protein